MFSLQERDGDSSVPRIMEEVVGVFQSIPQVQVSERVGEQIVDVTGSHVGVRFQLQLRTQGSYH